MFLLLSEQTAKDFNTEIAAVRSLGNLAFIMGEPQQGRVEYQKALGIFSKYQGYDPYTVTSTNIMTELAWANSEAAMGTRSAAGQHLDNAEQMLTNLPVGPGAEMMRTQVAQARNSLQGGGVLTTPVPGSPLTSVPPRSQ